MKPLVVFGTGELGDLAHFYFTRDASRRVVAHTVDRSYVREASFCGVPVVAFEDVADAFPPAEYELFVALGYTNLNQARAGKVAEARARGYHLATYVSSRTVTWPGLAIGANCFVMEANVIQPFVRVGDNVMIWSGNLISHHVNVGDNCFIASHVVIGGGARIGPNCFIGMNATIREHITIGGHSIIGAGSVILQPVAEGAAHLVESTPAGRLPAARLKRLLTS